MLPVGFGLSKSNLQDFLDCPRRFQLRYIARQLWPAARAEPQLELERRLRLGTRFHRLIERHQRGVDADLLKRTIAADEVELLSWWRAYQQFALLHDKEGHRFPEYALSAEHAGHRWTAIYDLVVVQPGNVSIFDWKTARRVPARATLETSLQTRLYLSLMATSGVELLGQDSGSCQLTLVYWYVTQPNDPVLITYSREQHEKDVTFLAELVSTVKRLEQVEVWPLTDDIRHCQFCPYRSLCGTRQLAGNTDDFENAFIIHDIDNISWDRITLDDVEDVGF